MSDNYIVYERMSDGPVDMRFIACIYGKARGEPVPFGLYGATIDDATASMKEKKGAILYESASPPAVKLRFIALDPSLDLFIFHADSEEGATSKLNAWWDFETMRPRNATAADKAPSGNRGAHFRKGSATGPTAAPKLTVTPVEIVAAIRSKKYRTQGHIATALGIKQTDVSVLKRQAVKDALITDDEVAAIFAEVRGSL